MIIAILILAAVLGFQAGAVSQLSSHYPQEEQSEQIPRGNLQDPQDHQPADKTPKGE